LLQARVGRADELADRRREDRDGDQHEDEDARRQRHLVLLEAAPEQLQRRPRGDRRVAGDDLVDAAVFGVQEIRAARTRAHKTYLVPRPGCETYSDTPPAGIEPASRA
jgi:hypothetical protein